MNFSSGKTTSHCLKQIKAQLLYRSLISRLYGVEARLAINDQWEFPALISISTASALSFEVLETLVRNQNFTKTGLSTRTVRTKVGSQGS